MDRGTQWNRADLRCVAFMLALAGAIGACGDSVDTWPALPSSTLDITVGPDGLIDLTLSGAKLGEDCSDTVPCRPGLFCTDGTCQPRGETPEDGQCVISKECDKGLTCGFEATCIPEGAGEEGAACTSPMDCKKDLYCKYLGMTGLCSKEGGADVTKPCEATSDCQGGLICDTVDKVCSPPLQILAGYLKARSCEEDPEGAPPTALFDVPRSGEASSEFYRLPFPNDIRVKGGHVDLSGHPTLEKNILGFDIVARYVDAIEQDMSGFSTVGSVIFRMSRSMKFKTLTAGKGDADTMVLMDITKGSPDYGSRWPVDWTAVSGKGSGGTYVCDNWLALRPLWARPLRQGTTYAAVLLDGISDSNGEDFVASDDFDAVMGAKAPGGAELSAAWKAYAPLRAYAEDADLVKCPADASTKDPCHSHIPASRMISAAVFTTGRADVMVDKLREAVDAAPQAVASDLVLCSGAAVSPCDDGLSGDEHLRGCMGVDPAYHEVHGRFVAPIWQKGTRPYLQPEDGGELALDASGNPAMQGTEEVCFAMSVPKGPQMPADGWPVIIYGHGTGGSFRSPMGNGFAAQVASIDVEGVKTGAIVLSFDQVAHGSRRGDSTLGPDVLFFNFANPRAAKGNVLQGVADYFQVENLAKSLVLPESLMGQEVRIDPAKIYFVGHSQGSTTGPAFLAHDPDVKLGILSGAGGGLILSLLGKASPVDIPSALGFILGDIDSSGKSRAGQHHPVLNLIQHYFDPIEPLNFASELFYEPAGGMAPKSILHVWGDGDTYVPDTTAKSLAAAMRATQATPYESAISGTNEKDPPFSKTWVVGDTWVTGAVTDHAPDGDYDGHFVMFQNKDAIRQAVQFIGTAIMSPDGIPTVVP